MTFTKEQLVSLEYILDAWIFDNEMRTTYEEVGELAEQILQKIREELK